MIVKQVLRDSNRHIDNLRKSSNLFCSIIPQVYDSTVNSFFRILLFFKKKLYINPKNVFLIIAYPRTGSTYLTSLLNSHPSIQVQSEIIGERIKSPTIMNIIKKNGIDNYLKFYSLIPPWKKVGGQKIVYIFFSKSFAQQTGLPVLTEELKKIEKDTTIKIIHLKRKNKLEIIRSNIVAIHVQSWTEYNKNNVQRTMPIIISPLICKQKFKEIERLERQFDILFKNHKSLEVYYEDLINRNPTVINTIFTFLKVPCAPLQSSILKLQYLPLKESIANYDELQKYFAKTKYHVFFKA